MQLSWLGHTTSRFSHRLAAVAKWATLRGSDLSFHSGPIIVGSIINVNEREMKKDEYKMSSEIVRDFERGVVPTHSLRFLGRSDVRSKYMSMQPETTRKTENLHTDRLFPIAAIRRSKTSFRSSPLGILLLLRA